MTAGQKCWPAVNCLTVDYANFLGFDCSLHVLYFSYWPFTPHTFCPLMWWYTEHNDSTPSLVYGFKTAVTAVIMVGIGVTTPSQWHIARVHIYPAHMREAIGFVRLSSLRPVKKWNLAIYRVKWFLYSKVTLEPPKICISVPDSDQGALILCISSSSY